MRPQAKKSAEPVAGVHAGDHVYYRAQDGQPTRGEVVCFGRDGFTAKCARGIHHKVGWDSYMAHKSRVPHKVKVVDQGEDGALGELPDGKRVLLMMSPDKPKMAKAAPALVLFMKGGPVANRPGLVLESVTDRVGHQTKRWKRAGGGHIGVGDHVHAAGHKVTGRVEQVDDRGVVVEGPGGVRTHIEHHELGEGVHKLDPQAHGTSKMSDDEIRQIHTHAGKVSGEIVHAGVGAQDKDAAYDSARKALPEFRQMSHKLAQDLGAKVFDSDGHGAMEYLQQNPGKAAVMLAPIKGETRAGEKADEDGWNNIRDLVRGSVVVGSLDDVPRVLKTMKAHGWHIARIKNRFHYHVGGYRDILMNVRTSNGHVAEMQLHVAPMILAKEKFGGHKHYEISRDVAGLHRKRSIKGGTVTGEEVKRKRHADQAMDGLYTHAWKGVRGIL